jgi:hypothetical protein
MTVHNTRTIAPTEEMPGLKAEGRRAISVQLARVIERSTRLLPVPKPGCSSASSAMICPIPKLTVATCIVVQKCANLDTVRNLGAIACLLSTCYKFLYSFNGAPSARRA